MDIYKVIVYVESTQEEMESFKPMFEELGKLTNCDVELRTPEPSMVRARFYKAAKECIKPTTSEPPTQPKQSPAAVDPLCAGDTSEFTGRIKTMMSLADIAEELKKVLPTKQAAPAVPKIGFIAMRIPAYNEEEATKFRADNCVGCFFADKEALVSNKPCCTYPGTTLSNSGVCKSRRTG